jgi:hypothetical protein
LCAWIECIVAGDKIGLGIDELLKARETSSRVWYFWVTMKARNRKSTGTKWYILGGFEG